MKILLMNSFFLLVACSSGSGSGEHPRQGVRYTIVCKDAHQQCLYKAADRCEGRGYHLIKTSETQRTGGVYGRYREFVMEIECR